MVVGQVSKMIGATVKRKEDPRLISGEGRYCRLRAWIRSPHAHAFDSSKGTTSRCAYINGCQGCLDARNEVQR